MKTTFIVRGLTPETMAEVEALPPCDAHARLARWAFGDLRHCVTVKYGASNAFRDRVEWNGKIKSGVPLTMTAEPRRGYRLVTFTA